MNEFIGLFILLIVVGGCLLALKNKPDMAFEKKMSRLFGWLFLSIGSVGMIAAGIVYFFIDTP